MSCCLCANKGLKLCGRCGVRRYCSAECQRKDWPEHKLVCSPNLPATKEDLDRGVALAAKILKGAQHRKESVVSVPMPKISTRAAKERDFAMLRALEESPRVASLNKYIRDHVREWWGSILGSFRRACLEAGLPKPVSWEDSGILSLACRTDVSADPRIPAGITTLDVWFVKSTAADCLYVKHTATQNYRDYVALYLAPSDVIWGEAWAREEKVLVRRPGPVLFVDWYTGEEQFGF